MNIKKLTIGLILSLLLGSGMAIAAYDSTGNERLDRGIKAYESGDYATALEIVRYYQGWVMAKLILAKMYQYGHGVPQDDETALEWYISAADPNYQANTEAQYSLGVMYLGGHGAIENHERAIKWFTEAAEQGHALSQVNLGQIYQDGKAIPVDNIKAYMWFIIAVHNNNGWNDPILRKEKVAKIMTSNQIAKAQEMASRCLESNYTDCRDSFLDRFYQIFK